MHIEKSNQKHLFLLVIAGLLEDLKKVECLELEAARFVCYLLFPFLYVAEEIVGNSEGDHEEIDSKSSEV